MNKKLLVLGFVVLVLAGFCLAQQEDIPSAGITPGNLFYGLDRAAESIQLAFTRNELKRAELHLKFAGERLAEMNKLVEKNKTKHIEKLLSDQEEELADAEAEIEKAVSKGQNATLVAEHVAEMTYKHVLVLQQVLDKVPEQARMSIQKAIDASIARNENAASTIEKETGKPADVPKAKDIKPVKAQETEQETEQEQETETEQKGVGKLKMQITDKPAGLDITKLEVTISSVKVHTSSNTFEGETCENETYVDEECVNETVVTGQNCTNETEIQEVCTNITEIAESCTNITEEQEVCVNETFYNLTCAEDECVNGTFVEEECINGTLVPGECVNESYEMPVCHMENITTGEECVNETIVTGQNCTNESVVVGETCTNVTEEQESCENVTKTITTCTDLSGDGAGWHEVVSSPKTFNLLELTNAKELLGETSLGAGKYTQIRLLVSSAKLWISGEEKSLKIPSGTIKLIHPFTINDGETTTLTIDFDASKSVHQAGSQYIMKPTIKVITE
jgi:hypothetical protein